MLKFQKTAYSTIAVSLVLRNELNLEKEKLETELNHHVSMSDLMRELLTLWRQQRNDPRPVPQRGAHEPAKLTPEEVKRLKELIAQNE